MSFKRILSTALATLFFFVMNAQQPGGSYDAAWKKIDSLMKQSKLPVSALTEINKVYERAKKEKNNGQLIKALIYKSYIIQEKEEEPLVKNIALMEKEISTSTDPARSVIQSITATMYWRYFQANRYRLYDRTETVGFKKDDVATWSTNDFHKKIGELYLASISKEKLLQQTKLEPFDPIIKKGNARRLRPTLYDLLAHRALNYFKNSEPTITNASFTFEINDPAAYADAATFADAKFDSQDSLSLNFQALQLYQRLIKFHLNDAKPDALIDVDVARLAYVYSNTILQNKEELYKNALEKITARYGQQPIATKAWYQLAYWYYQQGMEYDPIENTANRYALLKAKEICETVAVQKDSSEGWANCKNLLQQIVRPELSMKTEKVNVPGEPFRTLIRWRNFTKLHFRIVKIDRRISETLTNNNSDNDDFWRKLLALPVLKTFNRDLPDTRDHQTHRAEISVDSLSIGQYALVASVDDQFSLKDNPLSVQYFYVSNISWVQRERDFYVLNRSTGQPITRADVQVWYQVYNSNSRRYDLRKGENIFTDKTGHFTISSPRNLNSNSQYLLEVRANNDHLFLDEYLFMYPERRNNDEEEDRHTYLFTDRSLYRPGQMVYVKGIIISRPKENSKSRIVPGFSTKLHLRDANGQVVNTVSVTSNEYGSYSATFNLPQGVLNGMFTIVEEGDKGIAGFRVEEYKRPRFITEIAQPTGTYRLNDTVQVTGNAKAYAGNSIDGATVKYRVTRQVIMPFWRYRYSKMIWPPHGRQNVEIAHGETKTDATGNFTISFKAIPDNKIDKKDQPTFYYEVHADVTDNTGETRSASTSVSVAYQALQLKMDIPNTVHKDSLKKIDLSSTNLAGIFEKTTVNVTMHKLLPPNRSLRERYWEQPDTFTMSKDEYIRLFPYDIYSDEDNPAKWQRGEKVLDITDTTSSNSTFDTRNPKLSAGWYVVEAITKDKYGEEVKAISYVQLYDVTISGPMTNAVLEAKQTTLEPGDKVAYTISTNADSAYIIQEIGKRDNKDTTSIVVLNNNSRNFEIPVTENDRGGMGVSIMFVKKNRVYHQSQTFAIPYTNKELKVSYATYRDKTLPGSQEKWTVTISGHKGAKVAAELLTGMYDASLDQFERHSWSAPSLWDYYSVRSPWNGRYNFDFLGSRERYVDIPQVHFPVTYDHLIIAENFYYGGLRNLRRDFTLAEGNVMFNEMTAPQAQAMKLIESAPGVQLDTAWAPSAPSPAPEEAPVQVRKNFNETAFFFPDLKTDADGNITFSFTMPEAVTTWKWMSLAHSKDLAFGYAEKEIVTQKDLMVQANAPRFLREGDRMDFSAKIANITDKELTGQVELQLIDPATGTSVDGWFQNMFPNQFFTVPANQTVPVSFTIEIPFKYSHPVTYKIIARAGNISDGEESIVPVVSNRMLVTESMPLPLRGQTTKSFKFDKLLKSGESETLSHQAITVEFTSNPAWYAVQALPYLMEYPYECAEQIFNRYYANALATTIANASPRIKEIFERWKTTDTAALMSNLEKNQELKMVLLEETPWVLQAKNESEQKRNIALLFDMVRMSNELKASINKLKEMQLSNGGFPWFKGGRDDIFITQYIVTGIGRLKKLDALSKDITTLNSIINTAIPYLDKRLQETYAELLRANKGKEPEKGGIGHYEIQYLYMRSFFPEKDIPAATQKAYAYYRKQAQQHWQTQGRYMQGMIALAMHRTKAPNTAKSIMASLKQNALFNEEMGMYWAQPSGYFWYQAPVEMQAILIEAFTEVTADTKAVGDMKTWLLKQKQTQNWRTTKATADACYALLLQGKDWLSNTPEVSIQLGKTTIRSTEQDAEAGTGYFKKTIEGKSVQPEMGNVEVFVKTENGKEAQPSWGAVYWQYFEDLDKITPAATPLKLTKKLFVEKNTDRGPVLQPINDGEALKVGDKIKVRIELRVDRPMEYVHMKDMRAASLEPVNVLSSYKWQGGLGYYESTKDASTNFFFSYLPKGTFVFEYALFVTHTGTFSNGITSIQCMYAPEFASHSEGVKIRVE